MTNENDFLVEIQDGFLEESTELLDQVEKCFLELEKNPTDIPILEKIFRLAHNIKGSASAVGFDGLSKFAHVLENLLVKLKNKEIVADSHIIDLLLKSNDQLNEYIVALKADKKAVVDTSDLAAKITATLSEKKMVPVAPIVIQEETPLNIGGEPPKTRVNIGEVLLAEKVISEDALEHAVKIQNSRLGEILVDQGELSEEKLKVALEKQKELNKSLPPPEEYIRLPIGKIESLLNMFGEQVILQSSLEHYREDIENHVADVNQVITNLNKITHDLQQTAISLRMISLSGVFNKMRRTIRDVAKSLGKEIDFKTDGEDTELDKSIVDELTSPLTHLIRNSADHGIEMPEDREKAGKKRSGTVTMRAYYKGRYFILEIEDDGKGLDQERIRAKAIKMGLIKGDKVLQHQDIINLIMASGFSTKDTATDISGRGVGMDAIRASIEKLRGTMTITSESGKGTKVTINLPPTLAIFNGMVVLIGDKKYIVPNSEVIEIFSVNMSDMHDVANLGKIIRINDRVFQVIDPSQVLAIAYEKRKDNVAKNKIMFVIQHESKYFGVLVDDILGQQRIVYKSLGKEIENLPGISGGTILGDGHVALILEMHDLISLHSRKSHGR